MGRKFHKEKKGSTVSFHDVSYEVSVRKLPWSCPSRISVLSHLSGILTPGMNAIMGPTGCGKSSLLDVLAGRKNPQNVSGYVLLDGDSQPARVHRQVCGYVVQDNIAVNTLTVRENIAFSAALRLPVHMSSKDRKARVSSVIEELGLSAVADRLLGTEFVRGVSGGERKRTCIGIELIKDPLVLYLDEPTTGLDAYTAGSVMKTLKRLADAGRTIVFSIHQPKYSIYRLFDRLTLLANGCMIYHGPAGHGPIDYFNQFGYVLEGYNNPADFLMDTIHGEVPVTNPDGEEGAEGQNDMTNPEMDLLLPSRSKDVAGSACPSVVQRLISLWQQSELFESCQRLVNAIACAHEARHVRSRSPSPIRTIGSSTITHWFDRFSPSQSDHPKPGECRVQSAPICRPLSGDQHTHEPEVRPTRQLGVRGSDVRSKQLITRTVSDSDTEVHHLIDRSPNLSDDVELHQFSNEGLPPSYGSARPFAGESDSSIPPAHPVVDRPHFFPFYRVRSKQPAQQNTLGSFSTNARSLTQLTSGDTQANSSSQSCSYRGRHSLINREVGEVGFDSSRTQGRSRSSRITSDFAVSLRKQARVSESHRHMRASRVCMEYDRARTAVQGGSQRSSCCLCFPRDGPYATSCCHQLVTLCRRQLLSMIRDYKSLLSHFIIQLIIALFLGIIYYDLDQSAESGIQNRTGLFFFTCVQLLFINSSMIDSFLRDRVIFKHEISGGFYRISAYFFAKIISEVLPVKALPALLFLPITYLMAGLRSSWRAFLFWELTVTLLTITASGIAFSVSTMVTDFRVGSMLLSMLFVLKMITSGFLINVLTLGCWISWLRYLSVLRFAINTLIINELSGMQFCSRTPSPYPISNVTNWESTENKMDGWPNRSMLISPEFGVTNCITGEQYMETQAIEFSSEWAVWQNQCGIIGIFILALLNAYIYLRAMKKYK